MPYATNDKISQDHFTGSIKITDEQYQDALNAMINGKVIKIVKKKMVIADQPEDVKE